MLYKFTGKGLFYTTGIILILTIILAPVGIYFIYLGRRAYIKINDQNFTYRMFTTKVIPFSGIKKIRIAQVAQGRYQISPGLPVIFSLVRVVPLIIEYGDGKKVKLSLNYFERPQEIAKVLSEKCGKEIEVPFELKEYMAGK